MSEWRDISEAPKDGTHFLACIAGTSFGFADGKRLPAIQTVVHWWDNPDGEGFYTSVNEMEPQRPFDATHWKPLDEPEAGLNAADDLLSATMMLYPEGEGHVVRLSFERRDEAERVFDWLEACANGQQPPPPGEDLK